MRKFKPDPIEKQLLKRLLTAVGGLSPEAKQQSIGTILRLLRKQLHMTQEQLARRSGIAQSSIARLESNKLNPSIQTLQRLYEALGCHYLVLPIPQVAPEEVVRNQATQLAKKRANYLKGTLLLEDQLPDHEVLQSLLEEEIAHLIGSGSSEIWDV